MLRFPVVSISDTRRRMVVALLVILGISLLAPWHTSASTDSVNTTERTTTKLAEGVYVIRHKDAPDTFPQGNTVVVIGENGVLIVDSCYLPSTAREDIAQIRQWTNKPVRYVLNTHWHQDHNYGNAAYAEAFPGVAIIAQAQTAKMMGLRLTAELAEYKQGIAEYQRQYNTGKDESGQPITDVTKESLKAAIDGSGAVWLEFQNLKLRFPDVTFERELAIDLGGREVQLKFLGRGNTSGDAVAYLPTEKILAAGDLVDHPVPYLGGGFPAEQIETLKRLEDIDANTIVPGHGEVLKGKEYVQLEIDFLTAVVRAIDQDIKTHGTGGKTRLEEIRKSVEQNINLEAWRRKFAGDDPDSRDFFDSFSWPGVIDAAHAELWPR